MLMNRSNSTCQTSQEVHIEQFISNIVVKILIYNTNINAKYKSKLIVKLGEYLFTPLIFIRVIWVVHIIFLFH